MSKILTAKTFRDVDKKHRWGAYAGNGEQLARSARGYDDEDEMIDDLAFITASEHDPEIYRDESEDREWRWKLMRDDGVVAMSSEGYKNRSDCDYAANLFLDAKLITEEAQNGE